MAHEIAAKLESFKSSEDVEVSREVRAQKKFDVIDKLNQSAVWLRD